MILIKKIIPTILIIIAFLMPHESILGQRSQEFLYGKITTKSNEQYVGFMRWGKEEIAWHDIFNSVKMDNIKVKSQNQKSNSLWDNFDWNLSSLWEDKYRQNSHTFACFFGDIKSLYLRSGEKVDLELKNGEIIKLEGGSNDIGTTISIHDYELGEVKIRWEKISRIDFSSGPFSADTPYGDLLFGAINTYRKGRFEGYIKWDLDERTSEDILDGNSNQQIAFKNIKTIYKKDNGVKVGLRSGRDVFLSGTNDVNSGNRGIAIYQEGIGSVQVSWKEFKSAEFYPNERQGPSYDKFETPKGINSEIYTYDDRKYEGLIVFDVDEKWELEFIDGDDDDVEYQIPIRFITRIVPKNKNYSLIQFKNGQAILLGDKQDVSSANDGILLFTRQKDEPKLIKWHEVLELKINH